MKRVVPFLLLFIATSVHADPTLRSQLTVYGDFVVVGTSMGRECNPFGSINPPDPLVGTYDCTTGQPGTFASDTSPDIFWRADDPAVGQARAGWDLTAADARTSVALNLPANTAVRYARLYWAALTPEADSMAGLTATFERPGGFSDMLVADTSAVGQRGQSGRYFYQSSADVTARVIEQGAGLYRVSAMKMTPFTDPAEVNEAFAGFWLVVVFETRSDPPLVAQRHIALFDGADQVDTSVTSACDDVDAVKGVCVTVSGFRIPPGDPTATVNAKMAIITYEGDYALTGDQMQFRPLHTAATAYQNLSNAYGALATNPSTNFFNATSSFFGVPVADLCGTAAVMSLPAATREIAAAHCNAGALPQNTGEPFSGGGMDVDTFNLSGLGLVADDTQARFRATTTSDFFVLSGFITSFASLSPNFLTSSKRVSTAPVAPNAVRPGDNARYTIVLKNSGNDGSILTSVTDVLDDRLAFVPGSLRSAATEAGLDAAPLTDVGGDDLGEYDDTTKTLTVRVGSGADTMTGGALAIGQQWYIRFDTIVQAGALGVVPNIASITSAGQGGSAEATYTTSGLDTPLIPQTPVVFPVSECRADADCKTPAKPHCKVGSAGPPIVGNQCVGCTGTADCSGVAPICASTAVCAPCSSDSQCAAATPATPFCAPNGACGACSATDVSLCDTGFCAVATGQCGCRNDTDCGADDSGRICSATKGCIAGCSTAAGRNSCGDGLVCSRVDGAVGHCIDRACNQPSDCAANPAGTTCVSDIGCGCVIDSDCSLVTGGDCNIITATCRAAESNKVKLPGDGLLEGGGLFRCSGGGDGSLAAFLCIALALMRRRATRRG